MKSQFDVRHPFFRPFWRRAVFVGVLAIWTGFELVSQNWIWGAIFGAATAYLAYHWFVVFNPKDYGDEE
jgi:multisubunit Na+/H+ antiporter MnhE subunit